MGGKQSKVVEYRQDPKMVAQMQAQAEQINELLKASKDQQATLFKQQQDSAAKMARYKQETEAAFQKRLSEMHHAHDQQLAQIQKSSEMIARQLVESKEDQARMKKAFVEMSIHHNYKMKFPMCKELADMKEKYPNAIFIQVLGDTGVGKSTLLNRVLGLSRKNEIFKTGKTETTVKTQFYDISRTIVGLIQKTKESGAGSALTGSCIEYLDQFNSNMPKIFLCDQPGIGGIKISAQTFFKTYTPGHYDYTIFCTASRLTENELFLTKHLQTYHKDFMVIRTKVDADLMVETEGELQNHEDFDELLDDLKTEFNKYLSDNIAGKSSCLYSGTPFQSYDGQEIQIKLLNEISNAVNNNNLFEIGRQITRQMN